MTKTEVLQELSDSREALLELIDGLTDQEMLEPALDNGWTVKDVVVHLTMWEAELVKLLFRAEQGRNPGTIHFRGKTTDEINAQWYQQNKDRDLEMALNDFHGVRKQTLRRVQSFTDEDLTDPDRFDWLGGHALWTWIAADSFKHEREHTEQIRAWRRGKGSANGRG